MKVLKIGLIVVGCLVGLVIIAAVGYRLFFSQKVAESFEVNSPELATKVLVATQGSSFKNALVSGITEDLGKKQVYIKVIDVSALPEINEAEWHALVVVNTCQSGKMQADAKDYLARAKELKKIILLTTSGSGSWKPEEVPVDSISSASRKKQVQPLVTEILKRLDGILENVSG